MTARALILALAAALSSVAQAATVQIANAAQSAVYVRDCRSPASQASGTLSPDFCDINGDFYGTMKQELYMTALGGLGSSVTASNSLGIAGGEATRASVDITGGLGELVIKQGAFTGTPYARVSAWNTALQSYTWNGSGAAQRSISASLDFSALSSGDFDAEPASAAASVFAGISIFSLDSSHFGVDTDLLWGSSTLEAMASTLPGYRNEVFQWQEGLPASPLSLATSFTLEAGRTYFLEIQLGTWARYGAYLDATHTFTAAWSDTEGLSAAAALAEPVLVGNVPEPASLLLMGAGLLMLARQRRR